MYSVLLLFPETRQPLVPWSTEMGWCLTLCVWPTSRTEKTPTDRWSVTGRWAPLPHPFLCSLSLLSLVSCWWTVSGIHLFLHRHFFLFLFLSPFVPRWFWQNVKSNYYISFWQNVDSSYCITVSGVQAKCLAVDERCGCWWWEVWLLLVRGVAVDERCGCWWEVWLLLMRGVAVADERCGCCVAVDNERCGCWWWEVWLLIMRGVAVDDERCGCW